MPPNRQREDPGVSLIPSWCEELRAARLARHWSEDDLADQIQNWEYRHGAGRSLGVSRSYVSEWETGKRGVSRDYAIRIEGITGLSVTEVNVMINDLYFPGEESQESARVE